MGEGHLNKIQCLDHVFCHIQNSTTSPRLESRNKYSMTFMTFQEPIFIVKSICLIPNTVGPEGYKIY